MAEIYVYIYLVAINIVGLLGDTATTAGNSNNNSNDGDENWTKSNSNYTHVYAFERQDRRWIFIIQIVVWIELNAAHTQQKNHNKLWHKHVVGIFAKCLILNRLASNLLCKWGLEDASIPYINRKNLIRFKSIKSGFQFEAQVVAIIS